MSMMSHLVVPLKIIYRMMGDKDSSGQFNGTIPCLASNVGLKLKTMVCSGSKDTEAMDKLSGSVLGYKWDASKDLMGIKLTTTSQKRGKVSELVPILRWPTWQASGSLLTIGEVSSASAIPYTIHSASAPLTRSSLSS